MKKIQLIFGILLIVAWATGVSAQEGFSLKGTVVSPYNKQPIPEALVAVQGVPGTVSTSQDGQFSIEIPAKGQIIEIWAPGYYNLVQPVSATEMTFVLIPKSKINFSEVFSTPFGDLNQRDKASAIGNLTKDNFSKNGLLIDDVLNGAIPGLRIVKGSGMPGEGSFMNLRGINSLIGGVSPLLVIDGVPYLPDMNESPIIGGFSNNVFNAFSASDIKNITLLKGAEATAYGSLGSNGVLLIETDDATDLETRVSFFGQYGMATQVNSMPVMGVHDYKTYVGDIALTHYDDMADILTDFPFLRDDPDYYYKFLYNNETDWQKIIMKPAFVTENLLKIKGGDAVAKYDLSFGYLNQAGIIDNSDLSRYHMRLNSNINVSRNIDFFASMSMAYLSNALHEQGMIPQTNPILAAMSKSPLLSAYGKDEYNHILPDYASIYNLDGTISVNNSVSNPLALISTSKVLNEGYDILMNGGLNYRINKNLKFTATVGVYSNYSRSELFIPGVSSGTIMPLADGLAKNTVREGIRETFNMYYGANVTYNKSLGFKHKIQAVAGWQAITTRKEFDAGEGRNTSSDFYKTLDNVSSVGRQFFGYNSLWNWMNAYFHGTYTYNNLISLGLNLAYDGASSIGSEASQFGLFPSVNGAIFLHNLKPVQTIGFINKLSLRAEYVSTGNSNFASNLSDYYYRNQVFRQLSGIVRDNIPNTGLKWENNSTINLGIDFSGFNHNLDITFDYYNNLASDVIIQKDISSAFGVGYIYDNMASIRNSGVEAGLQVYLANTRNFHFLIGGTVATNTSVVEDLGGEEEKIIDFEDGAALVTREGQSVYSFFGYQTDGIYSTSQEALDAGLTNYAGTAFAAGDVKYIDQNGDKKIDKYDRVTIGDPNPDLFGSLYTSIRFMRLSLDLNFTYSYGNSVYNALRREYEAMDDFGNQLVSVTRRWTEEGQVTDIPRALYGDPIGNSAFSDRWIEDGSFLKLKALTLSYAFKQGDLKLLNGGSVFVSAENLLTFTSYLGYDPELSYSYEPYKQGIDFGKVPQPRTFKIGFKLQF